MLAALFARKIRVRASLRCSVKGGRLDMDPIPLQFMENRLDTLRSHHLYRQLRTASDGSEAWLTIEERPVLNLSSNNYLGLASHPDLKAAIAAAAVEGGGMGSSRLISGSSERHHLLEECFARFKG